MRKSLPIVPLALSIITAAPPSHAEYQLPPAPLQAIVDAPRAPALSLSPKRNLAAMVSTPELPSIVEVAQPELKLAGLRINPRTYSPSRFSFGTGLTLLDIPTQAEMKVTGLPKPLRLADTAWSPDQRYLAFTHVALADKGGESKVELWLVDIATRAARKLTTQPMSYVAGAGFSWLPDASGLLVYLRPAALAKAPLATGIPSGPSIQDSQSNSGARQLRTYPDLLKNEEDARLFEHYATIQLALVDLAGKARMVGAPDMFVGARVAPNGKYILTQALQRPFSYAVPASAFANRVDVRDLSGKTLHLVADKPLEEGLPPGNDAVSAGVRSVSWRIDAPATLVWAEAQDGGDPAKPAEVRDVVYMQAAPFADKPAVLAKLGSRYNGIQWGRGDLALLSEGWYKTRAVKTWRIAPDMPATRAGTGVRLFRRRPLQQSGPAGRAARCRRLAAPADRAGFDHPARWRRRIERGRPPLHRPFQPGHQKEGAPVPERRAVLRKRGGGAERRRHAPAVDARIADRAAQLLHSRPDAKAAPRN